MIEEFKLKDNRMVEIRDLTKADYEKDNNYEFAHEWLHEVNTYLNLEFNKEDLERDKKQMYDLLEKDEEIMIGALYNGKIIGTADLRVNTLKKMKHVGGWGIAIHPDFHNQGLGTKLLMFIESLAREKGLIRLEADFYEGNIAAETLYIKKLHYEIEGIHKKAVLLSDGTYANKISIGKLL